MTEVYITSVINRSPSRLVGLRRSLASKWNTIEHKLFSFISINWKGRPLTSYEVIVNLIASTKISSGLKVYAVLDDRTYQLKKEVSDQEMETLNIERNDFHGEWNYTIRPRL